MIDDSRDHQPARAILPAWPAIDAEQRDRWATLRARADRVRGFPVRPLHELPTTQRQQPTCVGRLTEEAALEAIDRLCSNESKTGIARVLGVSRSAINALAHGRSWTRLSWPPGFAPCARGCTEVTRLPG